MTTQLCCDREKLFAKINGQLAFLDVAFTALKQADIGEKVLTQMQRGIAAIRSALRQADAPELEAFSCDFDDLLSLMCTGEIQLTVETIHLVRRATRALAQGVQAFQQGDTGAEEVRYARDAVFSALLENAVTVKR